MDDFIYECIYCGTKINNKDDLTYHLKLTHSNVLLSNRKEILKDFEKQYYRYEKKQPSKWHKERIENRKKMFQEFQSNILIILKDAGCKNEYLQLIENSNNIKSLRNEMKNNFDDKTITLIEESGYQIIFPKGPSIPKAKKKKKIKVKSKLLKNYFDKSMNSIRAIKTPMGNKR